MCLTSRRSDLAQKLERAGIQVLYSPWSSPYCPLQPLFIASHLRQTHFDLVHVHLFPAQLWTIFGARLVRWEVPLVTTEHSTWNRRRRLPLRRVDRWMYSAYTRVACIGSTTELALRDWLGPMPLRTTIIQNGIDLTAFAAATERQSALADPNPVCRILCVASLTERKDHATLLRAISQLPGAELHLVGSGPLRGALERLTANLRITDRVHFLGERLDIAELLAGADIYVQPSRWEGFGIAALEAMATGLPVVASNVPGLREVVGDAGVLFEPGSDSELRDRLDHLMSSSSARHDLGSRARVRAHHFSVDMTAAAYHSMYSSVVNQGEHFKARPEVYPV